MSKGVDFQRWLKNWGLLLVPAVCAAVAIVTYAVTFHDLPATESPQAWGTFGDFLGGLLNPLVSTLTLFVAICVWRLQRKELKLTRKELKRTKLAMEEQAKTAEQQRQEQRFFDLLNVYYRTINAISYVYIDPQSIPHGKIASETYEGMEAMKRWLAHSDGLLPFTFNKGSAIAGHGFNPHEQEVQNKDTLTVSWTQEEPERHLGSYFRVVHHLLIEAPKLLGDQHERYVALFRAQLSETELILLAYRLWLDVKGREMEQQIRSYKLLENLPTGDLRTELENDFGHELFGNVDKPLSTGQMRGDTPPR